jgi:hypothetical protein
MSSMPARKTRDAKTRDASKSTGRDEGPGRPDKPDGTENAGGSTSSPAGSHEWLTFEDEDELRTWMFDVTFLLSPWTCIFGHGCQGVLTGPAAELSQGCCSYGAHFTGDEDVARVKAAAATLSAKDWQFADRARRGVVTRQPDGTRVTRLVDDACIFLNRPDHPGGAGCALHRAALARGIPPMRLKPDVCWQLPLRREDSTDASGRVTSVVTQWDRRHWGEGGEEFHWWCTEAPEAFAGSEPVYVTMADELVGLVGQTTYLRLCGYLDERRGGGRPLPHPALRIRPS